MKSQARPLNFRPSPSAATLCLLCFFFQGTCCSKDYRGFQHELRKLQEDEMQAEHITELRASALHAHGSTWAPCR